MLGRAPDIQQVATKPFLKMGWKGPAGGPFPSHVIEG